MCFHQTKPVPPIGIPGNNWQSQSAPPTLYLVGRLSLLISTQELTKQQLACSKNQSRNWLVAKNNQGNWLIAGINQRAGLQQESIKATNLSQISFK
jgi:hypothetical protein